MVPRNIYLRQRNYVSVNDDQPEAPGLLATSHESRREGKRYYTLCQDLKSVPEQQHHGRQNMVWINLHTDSFIWDEVFLSTQLVLLPLPWVVADPKTYFSFEDSVISNIRFLESLCTIGKPSLGFHLRMVLKVLERVLLQRSLQVFKLQYWFWETMDYANLVDLILANNRTKACLKKWLAKEHDEWTVDVQIETGDIPCHSHI